MRENIFDESWQTCWTSSSVESTIFLISPNKNMRDGYSCEVTEAAKQNTASKKERKATTEKITN